MAGIWEAHDRSKFETFAISLGVDDGSEMRARVQRSFEHFIDVRDRSDEEIAALLREREIDIVIDLAGYSGYCRPRILALRPAPVQVNYLGYPATMGAEFIDYIIADRTLIGEADRQHYSEKVVYLPDSYMPNDRRRRIAEHRPSRAEAGLPPDGFVFCSFNRASKLLPETFDIWMRLLNKVEHSVLWLADPGRPVAIQNLRREAEARGVAADRLIFAPHLPRDEDHLARLPLADLFLDTEPYNAHATAADALWTGLPVLTLKGETFASRVAASLLNAVGLPEMVTQTPQVYENVALMLAREPSTIAALKAKLARNRETLRCSIRPASRATSKRPTCACGSVPRAALSPRASPSRRFREHVPAAERPAPASGGQSCGGRATLWRGAAHQSATNSRRSMRSASLYYQSCALSRTPSG